MNPNELAELLEQILKQTILTQAHISATNGCLFLNNIEQSKYFNGCALIEIKDIREKLEFILYK